MVPGFLYSDAIAGLKQTSNNLDDFLAHTACCSCNRIWVPSADGSTSLSREVGRVNIRAGRGNYGGILIETYSFDS